MNALLTHAQNKFLSTFLTLIYIISYLHINPKDSLQ